MNFATSNLLSKTKQRERPNGCIVFLHWLPAYILVSCVNVDSSYIGVGLSALYQRCTLKDDISYLLPT